MSISRFIALFLLISGAAFGQSFRSGFNLGITASQVSGDNLSGYNKLGFSGGIFVEREIQASTKLDFGIRLIQKGSRMGPNKREKTGSDYKIGLSYLEVPMHYRKDVYDRINIGLGLGFGFLVSEFEGDGDGAYPQFISFNPIEVSARIEMEYALSGDGSLKVGISNSIIPIRAHASGGTNRLNYGMLNNVVEFSYQYRFGR